MNNLILEMDVLAGSDISHVAVEMVAVANRLGVFLKADFNGHTIYANPGSTMAETIVSDYHHHMMRPKPTEPEKMPDAKEILRTVCDSNGGLITVEFHKNGLTEITDAEGGTSRINDLRDIPKLIQALIEVYTKATIPEFLECPNPDCPDGNPQIVGGSFGMFAVLCGTCSLQGPSALTEAKAFAAFARIRVEKE